MGAEICVVTPILPPAFDGLGDYCRQLWRSWPGSRSEAGTSGPAWDFLVTGGAQESHEIWPEVSITRFDKSRQGLLDALAGTRAQTVLLQYVGYGYDPAGQPFWLPEALKDWQSGGSHRRIAVMFHETWASGMPWQRVYWQAEKQRRCAAALLALANPAVTSNMATYRDLQSLGLPNSIRLIPLGSSFTIGSPAEKNWSSLLISGKEASRLRAIKLHGPLIRSLTKAGTVKRIVLAGAGTSLDSDPGARLLAAWALSAEIIACYNFPSDSLPHEVASAGLSLMHTESTCLLKSTSFQLAAQLGQIPIVIQELDPGDSIIRGKHYLGYRVGRPEEIAAKLTEKERLAEVSSHLKELGATRLSWTEIAKSWSDILQT